jgi:hypothetical protein
MAADSGASGATGRAVVLVWRHRQGIWQPAWVRLAVSHVKHRPDDLTPPRRVGAAIAVPLKHDRGPSASMHAK